MSEELKENMCIVEFECISEAEYCVFGKEGPGCCEYENPTGYCNSSVARVNAMVLECKRLGFVATDEIQKNVLIEIQILLKQSLESGCGLKPVEIAMEKINKYLKI